MLTDFVEGEISACSFFRLMVLILVVVLPLFIKAFLAMWTVLLEKSRLNIQCSINEYIWSCFKSTIQKWFLVHPNHHMQQNALQKKSDSPCSDNQNLF